VAKMRPSPEIERLEARQLPDASLSPASLGLVAVLSREPTSLTDSGATAVQNRISDGALQQEQTPTGNAAAPLAALWPTPSAAGNMAPGQGPTQPASAGEPSNGPSLEAFKADSFSPSHADKLLSLTDGNFPNKGLPSSPAVSTHPAAKLPRGFSAGEQGRLSSEEFTFREEVATAARQREASATTEGKRFASDAGSAGQRRASGLFSGRRREPTPAELDILFSCLMSPFPRDAFRSLAVERKQLGPGEVGDFFAWAASRSASGPPAAMEVEPVPRRVEPLLATLGVAIAGLEPLLLRTAKPDEEQPAEEREHLPVPPLYLSVLLYRRPGKPLDPAAQQGLDRLCAYAWSSIHNAEKAHGVKFVSPEDMVQEIYLEWRGLVGPRPEDEALSQLLHDSSEEMRFLRLAVQRVIGRTRYQQKQWTKGSGLPGPDCRSDALIRPGEQERVDWEDLWENVVSTLAANEKQVLELRKQGKTFAEIGSELGMPKQRACETYHSAVARLQKSYPQW
jgi:hypothetical protein